MLRPIRLGLLLLLLLPLLLPVGSVLAQGPAEQLVPAQVPDVDAMRTREELRELLRRHPSEVGTVLALSPSLLGNEGYMASYPALQAFVEQHPEVASNPGYFFAGYAEDGDARTPTMRFWEDFLFGVAMFLSFSLAALLLVWLVKTILEQRRWRHVARVQAEVHQKVLDRMASNEQLLAYIETPAGRRFLESAPIALEAPRPVSAPVGRVLWSMQAGLVLAAGGMGLLLVSRQLPVDAELPIRVVGVVILSVGVGFVVSALGSFFVSRRLGLWQEPAVKQP